MKQGKRKRKLRVILPAILACVVGFALMGMDNRLMESTVEVQSDKIVSPVRVALLTDLHGCIYGEGQETLLAVLAEGKPDLILLAGDMVDDEMSWDGSWQLFAGIADAYDCYYVTGNHEFWSGEAEEIKDTIRAYGVTVLEGDSVTVTVNGTALNLCGVDDPDVDESAFEGQLADASAAAQPGLYTILLAHRPERLEQYAAYPVDLVVSGHAHGGQWAIPYLLDGLYAPNQGLFPKYTGGLYQEGETQMVLSRGLARESTMVPRIYNPPEVVWIDCLPMESV
ncbi:MAG: metallophosphoesterase [Oscillospiraceae bacterium]|nr:metallophosphoesterase [Oscillospiraceae bacterium]